ncbi:hypothetical protein HAX54_040714 [Datura stramonium]|uniref:Uncharacterized protein n=1 Tax=Datura stramonium TaxID=4076 RepID=A0ABS8VS43_DATST|nr:hypothetical protein [Datura stramonium]
MDEKLRLSMLVELLPKQYFYNDTFTAVARLLPRSSTTAARPNPSEDYDPTGSLDLTSSVAVDVRSEGELIRA